MGIVIGILGFVLYFIYDINQVKFHHKLLNYCFFAGCVLIVLSTLSLLKYQIKCYWGSLIVIIAFVLEIYVLFFALDYKDTYIDNKFVVCDKKAYALCRHPGFYSFLLIYLGLYLTFLNTYAFWMMIIYNLLNFSYICFQDHYTFMHTFENYGEYKKRVPFIIFNKNSIKKCFRG